jgi:hypothetical protein
MFKQTEKARALTSHFFRRFFDNDTVSLEGETETTVVRALTMIAVPTLMVAFFLLPGYPRHAPWIAAAIHYFFVLYSFVAMGCVATLEWEMLFPDRMDFLILLPLPLKMRDLFAAKARALLSFLGMFLLAANVSGALLLPMVAGAARLLPANAFGEYLRMFMAHGVAVFAAGVASALMVLAIEGVAICVLPERWFRVLSPMVQSLLICSLLFAVLLLPVISMDMRHLLTVPSRFSRCMPPLWFLAMYESLGRSETTTEYSRSLARLGGWAMLIAFLVVLVTYPLAWRRRQRMAMEGASQSREKRLGRLSLLVDRIFVRTSEERAVFHFISQTILRKGRYQVYLAVYAGIGMAFCLCFALTFGLLSGATRELDFPALSEEGLHTVMPLVLFWMTAGVRMVFSMPVDMKARWIFQMNPPSGEKIFSAVETWIRLCAGSLMVILLVLLAWHGWSLWQLTVQAVCGVCLASLLMDLFFFFPSGIPFTRPRLPGRNSLPLVLTIFVFGFPACVVSAYRLELRAEAWPLTLIWLGIVAVGVRVGLHHARRSPVYPPDEAFGDETDNSILTLGISA